MKCMCLVRWKEARRKGAGETYLRPDRIVSWWHTSDVGVFSNGETLAWYVEHDYEVCDGNITAKVSAVDEPYYGGSNAAMEIRYCCDKCGNTFFPHLPDDADSLSRVLTTFIGAADYDELINKAKSAHVAAEEQREAMLAGYRARQTK